MKSRFMLLTRFCVYALGIAFLTESALSAEITATLDRDAVIDTRGMTLVTGATYGSAINGESFEKETISTCNGYQYSAYWVKDTSSGTAYYIAVARRPIESPTWEVANLTTSTFVNGLSGGNPADAHNVVSLGIDPNDGTIHLAYDMHGHTLRYRVTGTGVTTNPGSVTWNASLFNAETSQLYSGQTVTTVTYPMFIRTPSNDLQFAYRKGASGNGSWVLYNYNGATHAWDTGHQYDDGTVGTYNGSPDRNAYPNGFTYSPDGKLHETFTWREGASTSNHDICYVYSEDGGNTWKNNAGTIVSDMDSGTSPPAQWSLNSPGIIVQPLSMNYSLMNQQTQNVDGDGKIHTIMWHLDTAKAPTSTSVFDSTISSYFHYWRDNLGNWHRNKLPGGVNLRPKIYFDEDDTAIAIYNLGGGADYHSGSTLVIAAATKASNWTDWKIIRQDYGPYFNEAQADPELIKTNGVLSVVMQNSPSTSLQATSIHSLDYTLSLTPPTAKTFLTATGDWDVSENWDASGMPNGNNIALINSNRTAWIDQAVSNVNDNVVIGSAGSNGALNVVSGASLTVGGTIIVGRDGGAVGAYNQFGGDVSSWRFVVGDYYNETFGGGVSSATVSGGALTTGELQVATSANGSSSGSTFTVSGGNVNVNGEVIIGEFGNTASVVLTGGTLTVAGDLREGFNQNNSSTLSFQGGALDMTGNAISVDTLTLNSGLLSNVSSINSGATITKNSTGTMRLSGSNTFTNAISIQSGVIRAESNLALGGTGGNTTITGGNDTGRLEITGNVSISESLILNGRQPTGDAENAPHILNISENNTIQGTIGTAVSGNQYNIQSDSGLLTINGNFQNNQYGSAGDVRYLKLMGNGDGQFNGIISDNNSITNPSKTALVKMGVGTWTISGANTYSGDTLISGGTLKLGPTPAGLYEGFIDSYFDTTTANPKTAVQLTTVKANTSIGATETWIYSGYINNSSSSNVTWTFAEYFDDAAWMKIDSTLVLNSTSWSDQTSGNYTLTPGLHYFELRVGGNGSPNGPRPGGVSSTGLGVAFNKNDGSGYQALTDPGNGSLFRLSNILNGYLPAASAVVMSADTTLDLNNYSMTIGSLADASGNPTGHRVLLGSGTLTTGGDDSSTTFAGVISGSGSLIKTGAGVFTLTGSNSYLGSTTIDEGTLALANGGSLDSSSGIINTSSGNFHVDAGIYSVSAIEGSGSTNLADNAILTVGHIIQSGLKISAGAKLIIAPSAETPPAMNNMASVPEPHTLMLLSVALCMGILRYLIQKCAPLS